MGTETFRRQRCPSCCTLVPTDVGECPVCGVMLRRGPAESRPVPPPSDPPPAKPTQPRQALPCWVIVIAVVLAIMIAVAVLLVVLANDNSQAVRFANQQLAHGAIKSFASKVSRLNDAKSPDKWLEVCRIRDENPPPAELAASHRFRLIFPLEGDARRPFVYIAVPVSLELACCSSFCDEEGRIFCTPIETEGQRIRLDLLNAASVKWTLPAGSSSPSRCDVEGLVFGRIK